MIALGLLVALLTPRFQSLRALDAAHALAASDANRLHGYEALAVCKPLPLNPDTAAFVAEQHRGARLSASERAQTVWRDIDAFDLAGNVSDKSVVWPQSDERWPGEDPIIPALQKHCEGQHGTLAGEYKALVTAAPQPVLAYERARVAFLVQHFEEKPAPEGLSEKLEPFDRLLRLEHRFALGQRSSAMQQAYAALASAMPKAKDALFVRQLQIASEAKDKTALEALTETPLSDVAMDHYRLAVLVTGAHGDDQSVIDAAVDAKGFDKEDANTEIIRERVRDAASRVPFARQSLAALESVNGKARLPHEVYRVATLAAARHNLATAKEAYVWILAHGKALTNEIHTKLALVAMLTLDAPMLKKELAKMADAPGAERQFASLVTAVRSGGVRDPSIIASLRQAIVTASKTLSKEAIAQMSADLDSASKVKALQISLADDTPAPAPVPPPVHFEFPEPYSLIPEL